MNNQNKQIVSVLIVVLVIALGYFLLRNTKPEDRNTATIKGIEVNTGNNAMNDIMGQIRAVTEEDHIWGNPKAEIMIVEYSDTECPFCKAFHSTMQRVIKENGDKVAWVYRHYPIAQLHPKAFYESVATECAWDQGGNTAFWEYTNELYRITQSNNRLPAEEIPNIAKYVGLNVSQFNSCLKSGKFDDKINRDITDGQLNGVEGTPTSFIMVNGKVVDIIEGAQSFEGVQQQIDALLK